MLGFAVEDVLGIESSFIEPLIIGAIAAVGAVLITIALFRNGKADLPVKILPRATAGISTANPVASQSISATGASERSTPGR